MAKDKKNKDDKAAVALDTTSYADSSDPDTNEEPAMADENDIDEEGFEFDPFLLLEGVELVDLAPDFVRPEGFLMVPRKNDKTGEIFPPSTTFAGILKDVIPWTDNRKKERLWFSFIATATLINTHYTGRDEKKQTFVKSVQQGDCIGVSGSGAINALKTKKGHFVALHWTGAKVPTRNGEMWEVIAKVSKEPVEKMPF